MACITVSEVAVLNNPASFSDPFSFDISYTATQDLAQDLEWKMIYVGSAESEELDQQLDCIMVGPVYAGSYRFVFEGDPPDPARLQPEDVVGISAILLTCSYKGSEFLRVGYYVNHEYEDEALREAPPPTPIISKLRRSILADHPRVTRFPNDFDSAPAQEEGMQEGMQVDDQGGGMGGGVALGYEGDGGMGGCEDGVEGGLESDAHNNAAAAAVMS